MAEYQSENVGAETDQLEGLSEKVIIPVVEEKVVFGKRIVESGKVRISKRISEHEETIDEPLFREQVSVERVAVNQNIDQIPEIRNHGDVMIIPVVEERIIVQKQLFLVEELHVKKQLIETHEPQQITLRKEEVDVERVSVNENAK